MVKYLDQRNKDAVIIVILCGGQGGTPFDPIQRSESDTWQIIKMLSSANLLLKSIGLFNIDDYINVDCEAYDSYGYRGINKNFNVKHSFKLKNNFDFFMVGCDGIFERLNNKDVIDSIWNRIDEQITSKTPDNLSPSHPHQRGKNKVGGSRAQQQFHYDEHIAAAEGVEISLREAAASRSLDNITVLILGLKNLKQTVKKLNDG